MSLNNTVGIFLGQNKEFAKSAAYLEAGRIVNNKLVQLIGPKLPLMLRGYADTGIGRVALANLLLAGVQKFKPEHEALNKLAFAAVTQAYTVGFEQLNIEGLIDSFLKDSSIAGATDLLKTFSAPSAE